MHGEKDVHVNLQEVRFFDEFQIVYNQRGPHLDTP
jgi:hypothetical protein